MKSIKKVVESCQEGGEKKKERKKVLLFPRTNDINMSATVPSDLLTLADQSPNYSRKESGGEKDT